MTAKEKAWVLGLSFVICLFVNSGVLWLIWLIAVIIIASRGSSNDSPQPPALEQARSGLVTQDAVSYDQLINTLQAEIAVETDEGVRAGLKRALEHANRLHNAPATVLPQAPTASQADTSETGEFDALPDYVPAAVYSDTPALSSPVALRPALDQTLALLYLGAFLFIGAVGLFLAYGGFPNGLRMFIIVATCVVFYAGGLWLASRQTKLRPAAISFTAIGLVMIPICGIAAHTLLGVNPTAAWVTASIVGLAGYAAAFWALRVELIAYLTILMWISLVESAVNVFDGPVFLFVWGAIAAGIVMQCGLLLTTKAKTSSFSLPAQNTSLVVVTAAAIGAFFLQSYGIELWQIGGSLLLAGGYYGLTIPAIQSVEEKNMMAIGSYTSAVVGTLLIAYDAFAGNTGAFVASILAIAGVTVAYLHVFWHKLAGSYGLYRQSLYFVAAFLPVLALGWAIESSGVMIVGVSGLVIINTLLLVRFVHWLPAALTVVGTLSLPLYILQWVAGNDGTVSAILHSIMLAGVGVILLLVRQLARHNLTLKFVYTFGYALAFGLSWLVSFMHPHAEWWVIASSVYAFVVFMLSYYEKKPDLAVLAPLFLGIALYHLLHVVAPEIEVVSAVSLALLCLTGLSYFASALLIKDATRNDIFVAWAVGGGVCAWACVFGGDFPGWYGPFALAVTGGIVCAETLRRQADPLIKIIPYAMWLLAAQQLYQAYGTAANWLFYAAIWSVYCGLAGYWLARRAHLSAPSIVTVASAAIILPTVLLALSAGSFPNGQLQLRGVAAAFVGVAVCHFVLRMLSRQYFAVKQAFFGAYLSALSLAWGVTLVTDDNAQVRLLVTVVYLAAVVASSYIERVPKLFVSAPVLAAIISWQGLSIVAPDTTMADRLAAAGLLTSVVSYVASVLLRGSSERNYILLLGTITAGLLTWVITLDQSNSSLPLLVSPLALAFVAGVVLSEANRLQLTPLMRLIPVAALNVAFQQLIHRYASDTNWLVYTHLWAVFLVYVVWVLKKQGLNDTVRTVKFSALTVFTLPTAYEALQNPAMYGYLLLAEHVALVVLGVMTKRRYITYWGLAVSVLSAMYMLRSFAFVQLGVTALLLIAYAVYRLIKSEKQES